jgi:hypothetical protein
LKQRIEIGFVALRQDGGFSTGVHGGSGPKIYKTENLARAAVRNHKDQKTRQPISYEFVPAFIEIEAGVPDGS